MLAREHFDAAWNTGVGYEPVTGHEFLLIQKTPSIVLARIDRDENLTWWMHLAGYPERVKLVQVERRWRPSYEYVEMS
jgi:hypothetical protein